MTNVIKAPHHFLLHGEMPLLPHGWGAAHRYCAWRGNGIVNYHTAAGQYLTSFTLSVPPVRVGVINWLHQGVEEGNYPAGHANANTYVGYPVS